MRHLPSSVTKDTSYSTIPFIIHVFGMLLSLLPIQITAIRDASYQDQSLVGALYSTGLQLRSPFGITILNVIAISMNGNSTTAVKGGSGLMVGCRFAFWTIVGWECLSFCWRW